MAILVDYNNVITAGILATYHEVGGGEISEPFVRHMAMMFFQTYRKKYPKHGEIILCCDGPNSWRKEHYPYYKANRVRDKDVDDSGFDWKEFYRVLNLVREEMKTRMPYKVIHIDRVEGDDGMGVLARNLKGPHTVVSNDKDMGQLTRYEGVTIYSPLKGIEVKINDPERYLREHIIYGDKGDFVPNILSDDDVFVNPDKRQKSIFKKKLDGYMEGELTDHFPEENVKRNVLMIDLEQIPQEYCDKIMASYEEQKEKKVTRSQIYDYFVEKRLAKLLEDIQNF